MSCLIFVPLPFVGCATLGAADGGLNTLDGVNDGAYPSGNLAIFVGDSGSPVMVCDPYGETVFVGLQYGGQSVNRQTFARLRDILAPFNYSLEHVKLSAKAEDINQDGKVDAADLARVLANWGQTKDPFSDMDGDGKVDGIDIGILMNAWGSYMIPTNTQTLPLPTPPPPPDADTPAQAGEPFSPAAQEGLSVQAEQTAAAGQAAAPTRPGFRERGRLRRRLRYLRQVRELGYRDLGGLVFDQHRFERGDAALVEAKVVAIETLDREIRSVEEVLELQTPYAELFIPGVSACARCGTLHGSDAHFCPHCGLAFGGPRAVAGLGSFNGNSPYEAEAQQAPTPTPDPYNTQPGNGPTA